LKLVSQEVLEANPDRSGHYTTEGGHHHEDERP
jgi:hypothetical protein